LDLADAALDRAPLPAMCGCVCHLTRSDALGAELADADARRRPTRSASAGHSVLGRDAERATPASRAALPAPLRAVPNRPRSFRRPACPSRQSPIRTGREDTVPRRALPVAARREG